MSDDAAVPPENGGATFLPLLEGRLGRALRLAPLALVLPPLLTFVLAPLPAERTPSLVPAVAVFAGVVAWTLWRPGRATAAVTLVLFVLAAVIVLLDPHSDWLILFYYPAVGAGLLSPARAAVVAVLAVAMTATLAAWLIQPNPNALEWGLECALLGFGALAIARLVETQRELALARAQIARLAVVDERLRIARDLHDLLGHGLSVISLKAQLAGRLLPDDPARAAVEVADIEQVVRSALDDVRAAVAGYRRLSLEGELRGANAMLEAAGARTEVHYEGGPLPEAVDETFAWSVREAVTNVVRHAHARRVTFAIRRLEASARLEIVNDGAGVHDRRPTAASADGRGGSGLAGLAERARRLGGGLEAGPTGDGRYRVVVELPVEEERG